MEPGSGGARHRAATFVTLLMAACAVLGVSAYRTGFGVANARVGAQQERIGETGIWVLPNPSGLNAHYQLPDLVEAYGDLRLALARGHDHPADA